MRASARVGRRLSVRDGEGWKAWRHERAAAAEQHGCTILATVRGYGDADYIVSCFEKVGFCVIPLEFSAREYGSPAERVRWWCIILDPPPEHAARAKDLFFTVFNSIKLKPFPAEEPPV